MDLKEAFKIRKKDAESDEVIGGLIPAGVITPFAGSTAPSGWLLCDGSAVSRTTYARLFQVIGTTYGAGNGSTTFNLPNLKGKIPVGYNSSETEFNSLGKTGGAKTHTLTVQEMPSHTHIQNAHTHTQAAHTHTANHAHSIRYKQFNIKAGTGYYVLRRNDSADAYDGEDSDAAITANVTTSSVTPTINNATATNQNTGGGQAHNNLQPYITMNYIIKY